MTSRSPAGYQHFEALPAAARSAGYEMPMTMASAAMRRAISTTPLFQPPSPLRNNTTPSAGRIGTYAITCLTIGTRSDLSFQSFAGAGWIDMDAAGFAGSTAARRGPAAEPFAERRAASISGPTRTPEGVASVVPEIP